MTNYFQTRKSIISLWRLLRPLIAANSEVRFLCSRHKLVTFDGPHYFFPCIKKCMHEREVDVRASCPISHVKFLFYSNSSTALPFFGGGRLFSFLILHTVRRTPWMRNQPFARRLTTHRTTQKHRKPAHRNPCPKWDSNPRSQCFSGRRQFIP
jgi:hypothetical protein